MIKNGPHWPRKGVNFDPKYDFLTQVGQFLGWNKPIPIENNGFGLNSDYFSINFAIVNLNGLISVSNWQFRLHSIFKWKIIRNKRISDIFEDKPILSDFLSDIRAPRAVFDSHRPIILLFNYMLPLIGCSQRTNQNIDCKWTSSQRPVLGHTFSSLFSEYWILMTSSLQFYDVRDSYLLIYLF